MTKTKKPNTNKTQQHNNNDKSRGWFTVVFFNEILKISVYKV